MNEIQKKRLAVLESTLNYFTSKNRAELVTACLYSPIEGVSEGCAVGRLKELCKQLDKLGGVSNDKVFDKLPSELQEMGRAFLSHLQTLHDVDNNWTETGLSPLGEETVKKIKFLYIEN